MVMNAFLPLFIVGTILAMESPAWVTGLETYLQWVLELATANLQFVVPLVGLWLLFVLFVDTKESSNVSGPTQQ